MADRHQRRTAPGSVFAGVEPLLMGGAGGLPFMGDAEDVLDGILQRLAIVAGLVWLFVRS